MNASILNTRSAVYTQDTKLKSGFGEKTKLFNFIRNSNSIILDHVHTIYQQKLPCILRKIIMLIC